MRASGELVEQLLDVHRALTLIIAAAHMAANHEGLVDVGQTTNAIEQLARDTAARVWALQDEVLPPEILHWEPGDDTMKLCKEYDERRRRSASRSIPSAEPESADV